LTHDFAVISLSDLLTSWETIETRLAAAAAADFVIVIYNPKSRRRSGHLEQAQKIVLKSRNPRTPVGIVSRANREGQTVTYCELADLHRAEVDMQTIVFIGSSASVRYLDFMVTPRGYATKYAMNVGRT
jgi:precorrin-3B C17-methyltransferase